VFVSFFPLLVAGPIERATHLLPQVANPREFKYSKAVDGMRQILWGLIKKIVIADNCAKIANLAFNHTNEYFGIFLILGALFFAFQIYGDFSGYSDIAIGVSRLFGFELIKNFNFPYFSRNIAEFWRRWHISLSSWFRDYVYIPLGGSKGSTWKKVRNTFIIFIVSGFWHGANWTFIVWGLINAIYFLPNLLTSTNRIYLDTVAKGKVFPTLKEFSSILLTFSLTVFAWIFFRAENLRHAFLYIKRMLSGLELKSCYLNAYDIFKEKFGFSIFILILIFIVIEWRGRINEYAIARLGITWPFYFRYLMYFLFVISLFCYGGSTQQFIYFQF
jgi:D-alanyl-lipoteichoic acid acyltransferase DltB (MBOAT superfamily)